MTLREFFKELPATGWTLLDSGCIRRTRGSASCPLTFVARKYGYHLWNRDFPAAQVLNLSDSVRKTIVAAADYPCARYRQRLLRACGLA